MQAIFQTVLIRTAFDRAGIWYTKHMITKDSQPKIDWQWLPLGYRVQHSGSAPLNGSTEFRIIFGMILNYLLPQDCLVRDQIVDVSSGEYPELFVVQGETRKVSAETEEEDWLPFEISLAATFKEFQGSHHIVYSLEWHHSEEIDPSIPLRELEVHEDIRLSRVEIHLSFFESRFTSIFGFSPVPTRTISAVATPESFEWSAQVEGVRSKSAALEALKQLTSSVRAIDSREGAALPH
jgi:hypothetical protein